MIISSLYDIGSIHDMGEQGELFSLLHSGPACPAGFQVAECDDDGDDRHSLHHNEKPGVGEQMHEAGQDGAWVGGC